MRAATNLLLATGLAASLISLPVLAIPNTDAPLPSFEISDITGQTHRATELRGHPTFLAVLTSRHASEATRAWMEQAGAHFRGTRVRLVTIVALDLSGVIPTGFVQSKARESTPQDQWHSTWLDRSGSVRQTLGLPGGDHLPYVFALDANGTVRAVAHAPFDAGQASRVFGALDGAR